MSQDPGTYNLSAYDLLGFLTSAKHSLRDNKPKNSRYCMDMIIISSDGEPPFTTFKQHRSVSTYQLLLANTRPLPG